MVTEALVVLVTAPDMVMAVRLGQALVNERLAACPNIVPAIRLIYRWENEVHDEAEVLLVIKTSAAARDYLMQRVLQVHPYDTPEVIGLPVVAGSAAYLRWLGDQIDVPAPSAEEAA